MAKQGYSDKKDNCDFLVLFNPDFWPILDGAGRKSPISPTEWMHGTMSTDFAEKLSLSRREFITGLVFVAASPAIVRAASIMPVKKIILQWTDKQWTDRFVVESKASYVYIRPRKGVTLTEEDWRQARLYRRRLESQWARQLANADSVAETSSISHTRFKGYCAYPC